MEGEGGGESKGEGGVEPAEARSKKENENENENEEDYYDSFVEFWKFCQRRALESNIFLRSSLLAAIKSGDAEAAEVEVEEKEEELFHDAFEYDVASSSDSEEEWYYLDRPTPPTTGISKPLSSSSRSSSTTTTTSKTNILVDGLLLKYFATDKTATHRMLLSLIDSIRVDDGHSNRPCAEDAEDVPITFDNLCCLNTILVLLVLVERKKIEGGVGRVVRTLVENEKAGGTHTHTSRRCVKLRRLLFFWQDYYRRGRDVTSILQASGYLIEWETFVLMVRRLCSDDGSEESLLEEPLETYLLPRSSYLIPINHLTAFRG